MSKSEQRGMTLLEVLVAASLLGVAFAALFGAISVSLRSVERIEVHSRVLAFAETQMNELLLANLQPGQHLSGEGQNGMRWEATTELFDRIRPSEQAASAPAVVRVQLTVFWQGRRGEQQFRLESLKIALPQEARP